jgi:hypothetical protein
LQALLSVQVVPLATIGCWQPLAGAQESVVQGLESSQLSAVPAVQTPLWQVSRPLQALRSLQGVLLMTFVCWQPLIG